MSELQSEYKPPYMPFYVRAFYGDFRVRTMTPRQRAMYRSLLDYGWTALRPCYIPNDQGQLWLMADADSLEQWERDKGPVLRMFTLTDDGEFYCKSRQLEEYAKITEQHRACSEAGKRSGQARRAQGTSVESEEGRSKVVQASLERPTNNQNQNQNQNHKDLSSKPNGFDETDRPVSIEHPATKLEEHLAVVNEVFAYYLEQTGRSAKLYSLTPLRKQKGLARVRECLKRTGDDLDKAKALLLCCVDQLCASDWHMGRDPKTGGARYLEWEKHLFPDVQKLEWWWDRARGQQ